MAAGVVTLSGAAVAGAVLYDNDHEDSGDSTVRALAASLSPSATRTARPTATRTTGTPIPTRPGGGSSFRLVGTASNRCVDVTGSSAKDGTPLQIWDCSGQPWQTWKFEPDRTVRSQGLCMDVAWGSTDNGATIQLARCNGNAAQKFSLTQAGDLVNSKANKCVDVKGRDTGNGARLQLWSCTGGANQKWRAA